MTLTFFGIRNDLGSIFVEMVRYSHKNFSATRENQIVGLTLTLHRSNAAMLEHYHLSSKKIHSD